MICIDRFLLLVEDILVDMRECLRLRSLPWDPLLGLLLLLFQWQSTVLPLLVSTIRFSPQVNYFSLFLILDFFKYSIQLVMEREEEQVFQYLNLMGKNGRKLKKQKFSFQMTDMRAKVLLLLTLQHLDLMNSEIRKEGKNNW